MAASRAVLVSTTIHGRVLVREVPNAVAIVAGCHGYMENAAVQMERLASIPGSDRWTLIAIQGLHRFYKGRTEEVVASWMTREDREAMIADNIAYIDAAIEALSPAPGVRLAWTGYSQGVGMAFRAAVRGRFGGCGLIAVGGDVPPELAADADAQFPPVLLVRGARDDSFTQARLDADAAMLHARDVPHSTLVVDGAHEWTAEVSTAAGEFLKILGF